MDWIVVAAFFVCEARAGDAGNTIIGLDWRYKSMDRITILWADDEIDLLKPHILFLREKGYEVIPVMSGTEALDELEEHTNSVDIVFLDENMPGLSGIETLTQLKAKYPHVPVIMITKSEDTGWSMLTR